MSSIITDKSMESMDGYMLANDAMELLTKHFPSWRWAVCVENGVIYIKNLTLHDKMGMQHLVRGLTKKKVLNAGGELLDRFGVKTRFSHADVADLDVEFNGQPKCDQWTPDQRYKRKTPEERAQHGDYKL